MRGIEHNVTIQFDERDSTVYLLLYTGENSVQHVV